MLVTVIDICEPEVKIMDSIDTPDSLTLPTPNDLIEITGPVPDFKKTTYLVIRRTFEGRTTDGGWNQMTSFVTIYVVPHIPGRTPESQIDDALRLNVCALCGRKLHRQDTDVHPSCLIAENANSSQGDVETRIES